MKRLMLLGGIRYLLPVIEAAHRLGVHVITADYLPGNIAHRFSDEFVNVSILDRDAVLAAACERRIDGILSFGVDPGVVTAAYVAEKMGLPFPPLASVEILQNKDKFRDFLEANGFNCPWHHSIDSSTSTFNFNSFPCIVKPVDSAGSKGCSRVNGPEEMSRAIAAARAESHSGRIIIEQFLEPVGHSSDTDSFSIDSELVYCSFNCQHFDARASNPYTPSGYTWPSDMPDAAQAELRREIARLIRLLKLGTHIYNIETRFCTDGKPYIMEVSPRGGGNRLAEILGMATGQDLVGNCVRAALGMGVAPMSDPVYGGAWAEVIVHSNKAGVYQRLDIPADFRAAHVVQEDMWIKPGDPVEEFSGANKTIGTLVLRFDTHESAERALDSSDAWLRTVVT